MDIYIGVSYIVYVVYIHLYMSGSGQVQFYCHISIQVLYRYNEMLVPGALSALFDRKTWSQTDNSVDPHTMWT